MTEPPTPLLSARLERAIRRAAEWHGGQARKGSTLPYVAHPYGVAMILERLGFSEDVVIAGLLHDAVEDTEATLETIAYEFGPAVAELVAACSEVKLDASGAKRPWADRKRDHLQTLAAAPVEARAVALADKLHNLASIAFDLDAGRAVWDVFNAGRDDVLAYYRACVARFRPGDVRLDRMAEECGAILDRIAAHPAAPREGQSIGNRPGGEATP